ncbi:MAG TPA: hypothetical protein VD866_10470 [Urbifossiella sp.]|nr:hypothetical protein [Urbifossiella sp.]
MRTALQATLALVTGIILLIVLLSVDTRRSTAADKAADFELRALIVTIVGWIIGLALLAFWMVMAWRAVRALESMAASLRRPAAPPPPPPATE